MATHKINDVVTHAAGSPPGIIFAISKGPYYRWDGMVETRQICMVMFPDGKTDSYWAHDLVPLPTDPTLPD